jgi:LacI family transcriptional regulator
MTPKASALMPFAREDVARLAGVSTITVPYVINDVLRSITQETQRRVVPAIAERHYLPGAIGPSLVTKTDFLGFILPDIAKLIHARWPGLSRKPRKRLTAASPSGSGTATSDPTVERARLAKLVTKEADSIGLRPASPNDELYVRWAGCWRDH